MVGVQQTSEETCPAGLTQGKLQVTTLGEKQTSKYKLPPPFVTFSIEFVGQMVVLSFVT